MTGKPIMASIIRPVRSFASDKEGSATIWALFTTLIFLAFMAFVIDMANAYRFRAALQAVADASSTAGLVAYNDEQQYKDVTGDLTTRTPEFRAREAAKALALTNLGGSSNGSVVKDSSVEIGWYDRNTRTFSTTGPTMNAVKVTALRTSSNGNPLSASLMSAFALLESWDVGATSIAASLRGKCDGGGFFSAGWATSQSDNDYIDNFCLHGEMGVDIQGNNDFELGTRISMADTNNFSEQGGNTGTADALMQASETLLVPGQIGGLKNDLLNIKETTFNGVTQIDQATVPGWMPFTVTDVVNPSGDWVGCPAAGTVYLLQNDKKLEILDTCPDSRDFAVYGNEVIVKKGPLVSGFVAIAKKLIKLESDSRIGDADYCATGTYSAHLFSEGDILTGSYGTYHGMFMGAQGMIDFGSNNYATENIYGEAWGDVNVQSNNTFGACDGLVTSPFLNVGATAEAGPTEYAIVQ